jgi:hypothetical protein
LTRFPQNRSDLPVGLDVVVRSPDEQRDIRVLCRTDPHVAALMRASVTGLG